MFVDRTDGYQMSYEFLKTYDFDIDTYYCPNDEATRPRPYVRRGMQSDGVRYDEYWKPHPGSGSIRYGAISSYVILMGDGTGGRNPRFPVSYYGDEDVRRAGYTRGARDIVFDDEEPDSVIMADAYRHADSGPYAYEQWWVVSHKSFGPQGVNKLSLDGSVIWLGNQDLKKQFFHAPYVMDFYW